MMLPEVFQTRSVILLPQLVRNIPRHADIIQRTNALRRQIVLLCLILPVRPKVGNPTAQPHPIRRFVASRNVQVSVNLKILLRSLVIPVPGEVPVTVPHHTDGI